jgi:hypothetical protein
VAERPSASTAAVFHTDRSTRLTMGKCSIHESPCWEW